MRMNTPACVHTNTPHPDAQHLMRRPMVQRLAICIAIGELVYADPASALRIFNRFAVTVSPPVLYSSLGTLYQIIKNFQTQQIIMMQIQKYM